MGNNEYILKHKDTDVLEFRIDKNSKIDNIKVINNIFCPINDKASEKSQIESFNIWINNRYIPNSRDGIEKFKQKYNIDDIKQIMINMYGLSLSDHYWIEREPFNNKWKDINIFENQYSELFGTILFNKNFTIKANFKGYDYRTPDVTTIGMLKKQWKYNEEEKKSYLIKGGSGIYKQEPFNEYYASLLLDEMNFEHTTYHVEKENNENVSVCPCITDINTEIVSANDLRLKYGIGKSYEALKLLIKKEGNINIVHSINKMIITDFLIDNTDRHWYNFGILRDSKTGSWIKAIPLFDNGYSLWNNDFVDSNIVSESSSFADSNEECMKYVNVEEYIVKFPDMVNIFDYAFEAYKNKKRKMELRKGIKEKMEDMRKYKNNN